MSRIRILMVDLKSDLPSRPYQLGLLASYARTAEDVASNVSFTFSEHPQAQPASAVAKTILDAGAQLVAISHYAWNHRKLCEVLALLATAPASLPYIVLGGPNCAGRFGTEMLRRYPMVSAIVEGEGEPAFKDICLALTDTPMRSPFLRARNCRFRSASGDIVALSTGHRMMSLDEIPSPYLTGLLPLGVPPVFYETNRGCPYRCAFCYWGNGNSRIHRMSAERIREEMTFFATHRVSDFYLADANFGIFESDLEIAALVAELNARHQYPFRTFGVNFAKNSSERVLEIAAILRRGRVFTTATLALQSVTPEAEKQSKRYAIPPAKFVDLVRSAHDDDIPTYTDMILGLPGETVDEFANGLAAVIATGIPAIKIHQLSLLPGTEFFDKQREFGLVTMAEAAEPSAAGEQRSDYWDFLVHSHPAMPHGDLQRGLRLVGINHLLHNLNLGKIVDFYLARYGVSHREVYEYVDGLLLCSGAALAGEHALFSRIRALILDFAAGKLDAYTFEGRLAMEVWFAGKGLHAPPNAPAAGALMHDVYRAFCAHRGLQLSPADDLLLHAMVDYNVLVSPKPRWVPPPRCTFPYDVDAIWRDILGCVYPRAPLPREARETWPQFAAQITEAIGALFTPEYVERRRGPVEYRVSNPMPLLPGRMRVAWVYSNRAWFCRVQRVERTADEPVAECSRT